jgi:hypothetical protein
MSLQPLVTMASHVLVSVMCPIDPNASSSQVARAFRPPMSL